MVMALKKETWMLVGLVAITLAVFLYFKVMEDYKPGAYDDFAKCLNQKDAVMYGAYWCGHCKDQKKMFGNSFKYIDYVECTEMEETCDKEGIGGYPTWKFADNVTKEGVLELMELSELTGCGLKKNG